MALVVIFGGMFGSGLRFCPHGLMQVPAPGPVCMPWFLPCTKFFLSDDRPCGLRLPSMTMFSEDSRHRGSRCDTPPVQHLSKMIHREEQASRHMGMYLTLPYCCTPGTGSWYLVYQVASDTLFSIYLGYLVSGSTSSVHSSVETQQHRSRVKHRKVPYWKGAVERTVLLEAGLPRVSAEHYDNNYGDGVLCCRRMLPRGQARCTGCSKVRGKVLRVLNKLTMDALRILL